MKLIRSLFTAVLVLSSLLSAFAQSSRLTRLWETDSTLKVPESVLYYAPENVLLVSCIDGKPNEKDLKGSISKVSATGKIIKQDWVINLSAPKGMGIYKGNLYVADLSEVVVIDLKTAVVKERIPVEGAIFLNDVTIDKDGVVYVSDSDTGKIHKIKGSIVSDYLRNKPGVNGLLAVNESMYLAVKDTLYHVDKDKKLTTVTTGMDESSDGIVQNGTELIVSCWNGIIYAIKPNGTKEILLDTREQKSNTADIWFNAATSTLYVPTFMKNKVVAYRVR